MHRYLRAVGFSAIERKQHEVRLLKSMEQSPIFGGKGHENHEESYMELLCEVGQGIGIILHGYREKDGKFQREFYFPYMEGLKMTPMEGCHVRRHKDNESYAVLSEEYRLGSALIFFLMNGIEYRERVEQHRPSELAGCYLTGMSVKGTILLPVQKTQRQIQKIKASTKERDQMLEAARDGDEEAMENLTMEDITLYSQISRRMLKEDVYSIVDSCFMPTGVECDHYMVIGDITKIDQIQNTWTQEIVYRLQIVCNGIDISICINNRDLLGQPEVGRRFKGDIWLQGYGVFQEPEK